MNKQEAIEKIEGGLMYEITRHIGKAVNIYDVIDIVKQIDEPEKPVVSQCVADWYEEHKDNFEFNLYRLCVDVDCDNCELDKEMMIWFDNGDNKQIVTLVKMKLFGYEVEKEKLYTVEIPNPNGSEYRKIYLAKNKDGEVELFTWSGYMSIDFADNWKQEENAQLTESEIKKDFAWAWQFAKEVEECSQKH